MIFNLFNTIPFSYHKKIWLGLHPFLELFLWLFHDPQIFLVVHLSEVLMAIQMITERKKCTETGKCTKKLESTSRRRKASFFKIKPHFPHLSSFKKLLLSIVYLYTYYAVLCKPYINYIVI